MAYIISMNVDLVRKWVTENEPQGMAKLSGRAEISISTVGNIIKHGHVPNLPVIRRIADAIGVPLTQLLELDEEETPPAA